MRTPSDKAKNHILNPFSFPPTAKDKYKFLSMGSVECSSLFLLSLDLKWILNLNAFSLGSHPKEHVTKIPF